MKPSREAILFWVGCCAASFLKLWMTAGDELIAMHMPHDQLWHVRAAEHLINGRWLGDYDYMTLLRQPGYALWMAVVHWLGMPFRLSQEILYLLAAFYLCWNFLKIKIPALFCVLLFTFLAFHPESFWMSMQALSETLYAPLLLFALGAMVAGLRSLGSRRGYLSAFLSGLFLAALWNVRPERLLLVGLILTYFFIMFFLHRPKSTSWKQALLRASTYPVLQLACILFVTAAISLANYRHYGIFSTSDNLSKGFQGANQALLRIRQNDPRRFVPISREARETAYRSSPAFREIMASMEGDVGKGWERLGCENTGVCDDISGAWFHLAFRDSVDRLGYYANAVNADSYYNRVAKEIDSACRDRQISCRSPGLFSSLAYVPPNISIFLPYFPNSLAKILKLFLYSSYSLGEESRIQPGPSAILQLYDEVAHRNPQKGLKTLVEIRGWLAGFEDPVVQIIAMREDDKKLKSDSVWESRPDVVDFFAKEGLTLTEEKSGFRIKILKPIDLGLDNLRLVALRKSGAETLLPILKDGAFESPIRGSYDEFSEIPTPRNLRSQMRDGLLFFYPIVVGALFLGGAVSLVVLLIRWRVWKKAPVLLSTAVLLGAAVVSRALMAAVLDASSFDVYRCLRILYPVMGLAVIFSALLVYIGSQTVGFSDYLARYVRRLSQLLASQEPPGDTRPADGLLKFGKAHLILLSASASLVIALSTFGFHGFSIGVWHDHIDKTPRDETLLGEPQAIRADDWMTAIPIALSQRNHRPPFPVVNTSIGSGQNMLVNSPTPIYHWVTLFRPQTWGYFLGADFGLAWNWWIRIGLLFSSYFLLFLLGSQNRFWTSFMGSLFLVLSPFFQFWSFCIEPISSYLALAFVASVYMLYSKSFWTRIAHSLLLAYAGIALFLTHYPAFAIPLAYLYCFLLAGYFIKARNEGRSLPAYRQSFALFLCALLLCIVAFGVFYAETKAVFNIVLNSSYPGKRFSTGGEITWAQLFSSFFLPFSQITDWQNLLNICEASGFLLFFPLIGASIFAGILNSWRFDAHLSLALLLFIGLGLVWVLWGFPAFAAKWSFFYLSPPRRFLLGIGIANAILLVTYLSQTSGGQKAYLKDFRSLALSLLWGGFLLLVGLHWHGKFQELSLFRVYSVTLALTILSFFFLRKSFFSLLLLCCFSLGLSYWFNPLSHGGSAYLMENPLSKKIIELNHSFGMETKWIAFNDKALGNLFRILSVKSLEGNHFYPHFDIWRVLDPNGIHYKNYNRYSMISFALNPKRDEIGFPPPEEDLVVRIHPDHPALAQLGVDFMIYSGDDFELFNEFRMYKKIGVIADKHLFQRRKAYPESTNNLDPFLGKPLKGGL